LERPNARFARSINGTGNSEPRNLVIARLLGWVVQARRK
jgi:hypothetical protein